MKLTQKTLQILKNFSVINPSILFRVGNTISTMSPQKTIMATAQIDEPIEEEFAIYDLSRFIGVISLFEEPELKLVDRGSNKEIVITGLSGDKTKYVPADPSNIVAPPADRKIKLPDIYAAFTLNESSFNKVLKAMSIMSLSEIAFVADGSKIYAKAVNSKNPTSDEYAIPVGDCESEFTAVVKSENIRLMSGEYNVEISTKGLIRFYNDSVEYIMPIEANQSKFN